MIVQSSIRRVRDTRRCWKLLHVFIDSRLLLLRGAGIETWRERERRASAALACRRGELCGSCGALEHLLGPVSVRPGDHWLSMLVTIDGSYVHLAIVGGLWASYRTRVFPKGKATSPGTPGWNTPRIARLYDAGGDVDETCSMRSGQPGASSVGVEMPEPSGNSPETTRATTHPALSSAILLRSPHATPSFELAQCDSTYYSCQ